MSLQKISCPKLQIAREWWILKWEIEVAMVACGLPAHHLTQDQSGHGMEYDCGGHSYSVLHETVVESSGLEWMSLAINSFLYLCRGCDILVCLKGSMMQRISLCLLSWIVRDSISERPGHIKRSYSTLSLKNEVKLEIYRGIVYSGIFLDYLADDHAWSHDMHSLIRDNIRFLTQDILETCHVVLMMTDFSADLEQYHVDQITPALRMATYVLETMTKLINSELSSSSESQPDNSLSYICMLTPRFNSSWRGMLEEIQFLGQRINASHPEPLKNGYANLTWAIYDFVDVLVADRKM